MLPFNGMIVDALHRIANHGESLSRDEARGVMSEVLAGKCTDAQIAALLVALHMKGETVEEIVGFAEAIRQAATPLKVAGNSTIWSTPAARAATPAGHSTSQPPQRSSRPGPECAWPNTATVASLRNVARRT
jgi:hypothetical protein